MAKSPFLESIRTFMIVRNYSRRTIDTYLYWIKYFILFHHKQHPDKLGATEIEAFLSYLAVQRKVSVSTQSIALNALVFLKTKFLQQALEPLHHFQKSHRQRKLPAQSRCQPA
ncbi:integron integrase IntI4 [Methylophaga lonarensis MPL]|uniref:Integron integrase IntI4 n=1 Tax=Methylophaga lonarensis MPL TaxID=1286106 RepID=M7PQS4_9GAMM|nr:site-specific integrase [Methylophaga lonarensis]EMR12764.1 integron integrase IntI4 [Methylophaga lonarensis MPL]